MQGRPRAVNQRNDDAAKDDENGDGGGAGQMAEGRVTQSQTLENPGSVDLLGDRHGSALQCNINHGSPPGGLHSALPLLKRVRGSHSSGLAATLQAALRAAVDKERAPCRRPFPFCPADHIDALTSLFHLASISFTTLSGIGM